MSNEPAVNPDRIFYVQVNNNSDQDFNDMFDGTPVTIEAKGSKNIRAEEANHLFGWSETATRESMFKYTSRRQGWNTTEYMVRESKNGPTLAERMFSQFEIKRVAYRMVEVSPDLDRPIPADATGIPVELPPPPPRNIGRNPYLEPT